MKKRSPRRAPVLLLVLAVLAGCGGPQDEASPGDPDRSASTTVSAMPRAPAGGTTEEEETPPPAVTYAPDITSDEVPVASDLTVSISQVRQADGHVSASARVNSDGTCVFQFDPSDGSRPVVREATAGSGACSVSIPEVEFALLGSWTLRTTLYDGSGKAQDSTDVTIH